MTKKEKMEKENTFRVNIDPKNKLAKLNIYRGDFNEYLARNEYELLGYTMIKLVICPLPRVHILNEPELQAVCSAFQKDDLWDFIKDLAIAGLPDFLCIKDDDYFFLECKAREPNFKSSQIEMFSFLREQNHPLKVFCTDVDAIFDYTESRVYEIS